MSRKLDYRIIYYNYKNTSQIDPQDIEQINVLKGESATAKYGSEGVHGVIVITSKKSKE
jgi:TonB-dependent SusC/RagA subfamily outer membrane receptor